MRPIPWLPLLAALVASLLLGLCSAWLIQLTGTWLDGAAWEHDLLAFAQTTVSPLLDPFFLVVPFFGTNYTLAPMVTIAVCWLWLYGHRLSAVHLAVVQVGSLLLNVVLKNALMRPRPDMYEPRGQHGLSAYPSGHSIAVTSVLVTAAFLLHRHGRGTWGYWVAGILFVLNNWSRVYLGVHWPTDVVGGVLVGGAWLVMTIALFRPLHRSQTSADPERR